MKWLEKVLEKVFDWAQDYGWGLPVLMFGILFGLALRGGPVDLGTLSGLGTFGAAIAAFWAVSLNSQDQRRRRKLEDQSRQPYLLVSAADFNIVNGETGNIEISFTNLSQHPVHIGEAIVSSDDDEPSVFMVGLLVPASQTVVFWSSYDVHLIRFGNVKFLFNYALTGPVLHSVSLPYVSRTLSRKDEEELKQFGPLYPHTRIAFIPEDQKLETNVPDEAETVRSLLEEIHKQPGL